MKVPKEWTAAVATTASRTQAKAATAASAMSFDTVTLRVPKVEAAAAVTARIDMSAEVAGAGLCPECKQPMQRCVTNGIQSLACHPDRIVIPVADSVLAAENVIETGELNLGAAFGPSTAQPGVV